MSDDSAPPPSLGDDLEQWTRDRLGCATASNVWRVLKRTQKGWSAERRKYEIELIGERLTGMRQEVFLSHRMRFGAETEGEGLRAYFQSNVSPLTLFVKHPKIAWSGCSPDGYVGNDGMVEFKCPDTKTHIETMLTGDIDEKYQQQMMWQLACHPDRKWVDFCSFDPRLPLELRLYTKRLYRDDEAIEAMENAVWEFLDDLDKDLATLGSYTPLALKRGDGREEIKVGYSDTLPESTFSGIEDLVKRGLIRKGMG